MKKAHARIKRQESIRKIFNIFHDGEIIRFKHSGSTLWLEVSIEYLAERIAPSFTSFQLALFGVENLQFVTWTRDVSLKSQKLTDADSMFKLGIGILNAETVNNEIKVYCTLDVDSPSTGYYGGELSFVADSAIVMDESSKSYTLEELEKLSKEYWTDWKKKNSKS